MTYQELLKAVQTFGLSGRADMFQIKARHRELVKRFHPDMSQAVDPAEIRAINEAYRILMEYCRNYAFSFEEEEFFEQNPEERLRQQFGEDPLWGSK